MPYMMVRSGSGYFVHKKNSDGSPGKRMNKKPLSKERAIKYLQALEINVQDAELDVSPAENKPEEEGLVFFKALPGNNWMAFYSNNFQDLTGEWFPEKGIDKFIEMIDTKQYDMPYLYFWHIPYPLGRADWVERIGHVTAAVGHYEDVGDKEIYDKFLEYFSNTNDLFMVSHGFIFNTKDKSDDTYHRFLTFEISPIPVDKGVPANPLTVFKSVQEFKMLVVSDEKKAKLAEILGPEVAERFLSLAEKYSDEISNLKMKYKEGEAGEVAPVGLENTGEDSADTPQAETGDPQTPEQTEIVEEVVEEPKEKAPQKPEDGSAQDEESPEKEDAGMGHEEGEHMGKTGDMGKMDKKDADRTGELADSIKAIANQGTALEMKIKSLEESISGISNFLRLQFGDPRPASKAVETEVSAADSLVADLKEKNVGSEDADQTLANLLPMFFGQR